MDRITAEERERFHRYLDEAIDKMNSPKNENKLHWSNLPVECLQKMVNTENAELEEAVFNFSVGLEKSGAVETENQDLINLNLMIIDNLRGN